MYDIINIKGKGKYLLDVCNIYALCFPNEAWSRTLILSELERGKHDYFACFKDGEIVAYLNGLSIGDEAELCRIGVNPMQRKKGIGSAVLKEYISYLVKNNCKRLFLEVRKSNLGAIELYKSVGFKTDGIRKDYYHSPTEDAYLMSLEF